MPEAFLAKIGGTADEKEIAKNKKKRGAEVRVSTYEKLGFVAEGFSISEIAKARGVQKGRLSRIWKN